MTKGLYILVEYPDALTSVNKLLLPFNKTAMDLATSQQVRTPIKEIFDWLQSSITSAAGVAGGIVTPGVGKAAQTVAGAGFELADILGYKLFNKKFYASTWAGAMPSEFSLSTELVTGWRNLYDGQKEVVTPIKKLYASTLPYASGASSSGFLRSPMPNTISVVTEFVGGYLNAAQDLATTYGTSLSADLDARNLASAANRATAYDSNETQKSSGRKWSLQFLYSPDGTKGVVFFTLKDLIVLSANLSLDPTLMDTAGYPCRGSITLSMKSQNIFTYLDVVGDSASDTKGMFDLDTISNINDF